MILPAIVLRLRVVVLVKARVVRRERNSFAWIILTIDTDLPTIVTEKPQVGFWNVVMTLFLHGNRLLFLSTTKII